MSTPSWNEWDLPAPHILRLAVESGDIDAYAHVNNAVYLIWCDRTAWDHSTSVGLPIERCKELDRGMAVLRTVIEYLRPAVAGDLVRVATWILPARGRLRIRRRFQIRCEADGVTLARAELDYACIMLSSGRPARWPPEFRERYVMNAEAVRAAEGLAKI